MPASKQWGDAPFWGLGHEWDPRWLLDETQLALQERLIDLCRTTLRDNAVESDRKLLYPRNFGNSTSGGNHVSAVGVGYHALRIQGYAYGAHGLPVALSDQDKVALQQYVTRCYGSLTSLNFLFQRDEDKFSGSTGD